MREANDTDVKGQAPEKPSWKLTVAKHANPARSRSLWQLTNSLLPYFGLWGLMIWTLSWSYWVTLVLAVFAAGFLVRAFIIFHDCTHGSFFRSRRANSFWGFVTGVLIFTPFAQWRRDHSVHHATSGDLDQRGTGDIWTLTVREYLESSRTRRFLYRLLRSPLVLFGVAGPYLFLIHHRFPSRGAGPRERRSVYWTNAGILAVGTVAGLSMGWSTYLLIQLTIMVIASSVGVWLFYVQHQFEGVYWERGGNWDFVGASLAGSSYYKLPKILQWFSGNIGFHHIHHLSPSIPNYNLEKCHREEAFFQSATHVTLRSSLKSLWFRLWDEEQRALVGFRHLRRLRAVRSGPGVPNA